MDAKGEEAEEGRIGSLGLADANYCIQDGKTISPPVQHRELYSICVCEYVTVCECVCVCV